MRERNTPALRFKGFRGDWERRNLESIARNTFGGGTPNTSVKEFWVGEIPWIQSSDLIEHDVMAVTIKKKISLLAISNSATKLVPKDSIAIVTRVGVGKVAVMQMEYSASQDFLSLSNLEVDKWFGAYSVYLKMQKELYKVQGTSIKGITKKDLLSKVFYTPSYKTEQTKIGDFFRNLDNLIAFNQRKYDKLLTVKKACLEKMFPQNGSNTPEIRFKGFSGEWEIQTALNIFETTSDKNHPELPVLSATQEYGMKKRDDIGLSIFHNKKNEKTYKRVLPGQFVIHLRSFQGGFAHSQIEGITSPAYTILKFKEESKHFDAFWKYIFNSNVFIKRLEAVTYGIRDGRNINFDEFMTMRFSYPTLEEQTQIGNFFKTLDNLIALRKTELEKLKNIKKACLEKMFV